MPSGIYIRTEKAKGILSAARLHRKKELGYINSPETRKKIGKARKGHIGHWKNKGFSEEHKKNLSIAGMGRVLSKEARKKISEARKGQPCPNKGKNGLFRHTEVAKRKMSFAKYNVKI